MLRVTDRVAGRVVRLRDRAIIWCIARLGLRAGEVAQLQLDDIDWCNAVVRVRARKTGHGALLPLSSKQGYPWDRAGVASTIASPGPVMSTAFCPSPAWWSRHVIWPCWSPPGRGVPDIRV